MKTEEEIGKIKLLRIAGCKCKNPLLVYIPNKGLCCKLCNIEYKKLWEELQMERQT